MKMMDDDGDNESTMDGGDGDEWAVVALNGNRRGSESTLYIGKVPTCIMRR
jgi:hypothetical protein